MNALVEQNNKKAKIMRLLLPLAHCKWLHVPHLSRTFEIRTEPPVRATPEPIFFSQSLDMPKEVKCIT